MPKMTHWNSPDVIEVSGEKAAVYQAQGWVVAGKSAAPVAREAVPAVTTATVDEPPKPAAKKAAAKKAAAKRTAKKS
jgi:hypothetical protein